MAEDGKSGRRGYHHGNLREALIEATRTLIAEKGVAGVTIADAARAAGVSPAAPYRHFQNREELIVARVLEQHRPALERQDAGLAAAMGQPQDPHPAARGPDGAARGHGR
ncbi:MAG: helix-turn-helix domain-containing protein, partial [Pseudomonadota bacterium]